jgi:hypothetical protein
VQRREFDVGLASLQRLHRIAVQAGCRAKVGGRLPQTFAGLPNLGAEAEEGAHAFNLAPQVVHFNVEHHM